MASKPIYCVVVPEGTAVRHLVYRPEGTIRTYYKDSVDGRAGITQYADTVGEATRLMTAGKPFACRTDIATKLYGWEHFAEVAS